MNNKIPLIKKVKGKFLTQRIKLLEEGRDIISAKQLFSELNQPLEQIIDLNYNMTTLKAIALIKPDLIMSDEEWKIIPDYRLIENFTVRSENNLILSKNQEEAQEIYASIEGRVINPMDLEFMKRNEYFVDYNKNYIFETNKNKKLSRYEAQRDKFLRVLIEDKKTLKNGINAMFEIIEKIHNSKLKNINYKESPHKHIFIKDYEDRKHDRALKILVPDTWQNITVANINIGYFAKGGIISFTNPLERNKVHIYGVDNAQYTKLAEKRYQEQKKRKQEQKINNFLIKYNSLKNIFKRKQENKTISK